MSYSLTGTRWRASARRRHRDDSALTARASLTLLILFFSLRLTRVTCHRSSLPLSVLVVVRPRQRFNSSLCTSHVLTDLSTRPWLLYFPSNLYSELTHRLSTYITTGFHYPPIPEPATVSDSEVPLWASKITIATTVALGKRTTITKSP